MKIFKVPMNNPCWVELLNISPMTANGNLKERKRGGTSMSLHELGIATRMSLRVCGCKGDAHDNDKHNCQRRGQGAVFNVSGNGPHAH